ncbi:MAG TPA: sigma-54 dependent transcriptional regulator [Vicinamibacteria bacterium]|nr:sigma-54 dependent transcriptional regulator [Vicinamibacteria bacterium]
MPNQQDPIASARAAFVARSESMLDLYRHIETIAPSSASVLIVGESGTGKELVARTLHGLSQREDGPFVALNCAAIPETLLESELFGHEKGAFTGATNRRAGCFELSHGGTLFLDELGALPLSSQPKLLRVLEERSFRRLRGTEVIRVDVRVVAALKGDPWQAVEEGRLRDDLFYRLNVFQLDLPPLRDRIVDIPLLAEYFVRQFAAKNDKRVTGLSPEAVRLLERYPWPGNVRELRNVIERTVIVSSGWLIQADELPRSILLDAQPRPTPSESFVDRDKDRSRTPSVGMTLEESTRWLVLRTLEASRFNKTRTARLLGVSPKTVYNKLKEWARNGDADAARAEAMCWERLRGKSSTYPARLEPAGANKSTA